MNIEWISEIRTLEIRKRPKTYDYDYHFGHGDVCHATLVTASLVMAIFVTGVTRYEATFVTVPFTLLQT